MHELIWLIYGDSKIVGGGRWGFHHYSERSKREWLQSFSTNLREMDMMKSSVLRDVNRAKETSVGNRSG